jgi:hypothetical protein
MTQVVRFTRKDTSFTAPVQVRDAIDGFVRVNNEDAAPFDWRKTSVSAAQPAFKYA